MTYFRRLPRSTQFLDAYNITPAKRDVFYRQGNSAQTAGNGISLGIF